jgi:hypothetical protein
VGELQEFWVAVVLGAGLMIGGIFALKQANPTLTTRVALGAVSFGLGIYLVYPIIVGGDVIGAHQIRLGFSIACIGFGINQLAAPVRVAFGRPA